jgi:hypothetical protein
MKKGEEEPVPFGTATPIDDVEEIRIGEGSYYVFGILCENRVDRLVPETDTSDDIPRRFLNPLKITSESKSYLVYLDVWERHITYLQNDDIREKALNGPDTTTRSQLIWQVGFQQTNQAATEFAPQTDLEKYVLFQEEFGIGATLPTKSKTGTGTGRLAAQTKEISHDNSDPCVLAPDSKYRGLENQLYRVEIHSSGVAQRKNGVPDETVATWKWSRDNGAVVFPIRRLATDSGSGTTTVTLEHIGRDERSRLSAGDWVEVVDDDYALTFGADNLLMVVEVRENDLQVVLKGTHDPAVGEAAERHPLLRRWNQKTTREVSLTEGGVLSVEEGKQVELEHGIVVEFEAPDKDPRRYYRTGDYWYIPARVATGDIEWPSDKGDPEKPEYLAPRGIEHHYSPLAHMAVTATGDIVITDLRRHIKHPVT